MNERIKLLVDTLKIKKAEFARRLNLSQPFVSELCSGKNNPSDRTISDICREFNVNEAWLRTGEGEMFVTLTKEEELTDFLGDLIKGERGDFARRLVTVLSRMTPDEWDMLERKAQELMDELGRGK